MTGDATSHFMVCLQDVLNSIKQEDLHMPYRLARKELNNKCCVSGTWVIRQHIPRRSTGAAMVYCLFTALPIWTMTRLKQECL